MGEEEVNCLITDATFVYEGNSNIYMKKQLEQNSTVSISEQWRMGIGIGKKYYLQLQMKIRNF